MSNFTSKHTHKEQSSLSNSFNIRQRDITSPSACKDRVVDISLAECIYPTNGFRWIYILRKEKMSIVIICQMKILLKRYYNCLIPIQKPAVPVGRQVTRWMVTGPICWPHVFVKSLFMMAMGRWVSDAALLLWELF